MQLVEIAPGELHSITLPDGREVRLSLSRFYTNNRGEVEARIGIDAPRDVPIFRSELLTQEWRRVLS